MRTIILLLFIIYSLATYSQERYIGVSKENPAYFSFGDGSTYIPIGINMINPSGGNSSNPDAAFAEIEEWMKNLSDNGGNYIRIWLSQSFWDIEQSAGKYDEQKAKRIDRFIELARKYHLRIKLTLEHFRSVTLEENPQSWATKFVYHTSRGGPLNNIGEYLTTQKGRQLFLDKIDYYQQRYGSDTLFFGWELWNEMNAVKGPENAVFYEWNETMLKKVKEKFPEHLVMQSLGSFDSESAKPVYNKIMSMPGNEVAQVHRYLDLGAEMKVCHAPMDIIASSAIKDLQAYNLGKPVILAETGAVEPRHAGPSKYYPKDKDGILLHDILFAPFFTGSAGPGMSWHWESYVHKNNLWYHFGRFNTAIKDIDPVEEEFVPEFKDLPLLRVYTLKGKHNTLVWVRDKMSNWQTEFEMGIPASAMLNASIEMHEIKPARKIRAYDPWTDKSNDVTITNGVVVLPEFKRSVVLRFVH